MEDYTPNSHKYKAELAAKDKQEKKVEKVIKGKAKVRKKSEMSKVKDIFISEDAQNVKSFIFMDILVPAVKKAISDIVTNGIDMILYGGTGISGKRTDASRISYRSFYDKKDDYRHLDSRVRTSYSYDDIVLDSRQEAEEVLTRMDELIDTYGVASVADLYDFVGAKSEYTDNKYGWMNLRSASVVRVRDGYLIKLPKALPIK